MDLPNKEVMGRRGTFNKMSKIYLPKDKNIIFETLEQSLTYFFTRKAIDSFKYCHKFQQKLIDNRALQLTIDFGVPENPKEKPWSDLWRDRKEELTIKGLWFKNPTEIIHNPKIHLF